MSSLSESLFRKIYSTKEWQEKRAVFIEGKSCEWNPNHKGPLVIDHLAYEKEDGTKFTDEEYMDFEKLHREGKLLVLCRRCAYARRNNKVLCKVCKENYHGKKYDMCFKCLIKQNPEDYVLCKECGVNHHHKNYKKCAMCFNKSKRSRSAKKGWSKRRGEGRKK